MGSVIRNSFTLLITFAALSACGLRPAWQTIAEQAEFQTGYVDTERFRHLVIGNRSPARQGEAGLLQIYVEGDGTPWIRPDRVAVDPTPTNPVMLRLMELSRQDAVYLGRPCYFGLATSRGCEPRWWTFARYSQPVIDSMCEAANEISAHAGAVELLGYSGGGAIVMRMAACTDKLVRIVTLAGNLDPAAWTKHHGYSPLTDIAPEAPGTAGSVRSIHLQCRDDTNIPPAITDRWFENHPDAIRRLVSQCTHASGWEEVAPPILGEYRLH